MIGSVLKDLRLFMMFFSMFIAAFAVLLSIVIKLDTNSEKEDGPYAGMGPLQFLFQVFRSSIGDNQMDDFLKTDDSQFLAWFIWIAIMIVGNIILMNLSIAVVN